MAAFRKHASVGRRQVTPGAAGTDRTAGSGGQGYGTRLDAGTERPSVRPAARGAPTMGRRAFWRYAATAAAGSAWGLAACSRGTDGRLHAPIQSTGPRVKLSVQANYFAVPPDKAVPFLTQALSPFLQANKQIDVVLQPVPAGPHPVSSPTLTALVGGQGPDIISDYDISPYVEKGLLLDLTPYVKGSNLDLSLFSAGQLHNYQSPDGRLYALPAYTAVAAVYVNLDILSGMGVHRPSPSWTYQEAQTIWEQTTVRSADPKKQRYGGKLNFLGLTNGPSAFYLHGWGGSYVDPNNRARCALDSPASVAAGEWCYAMLAEGLCSTSANFGSGQLTTDVEGTAFTLYSALNWRGLNWRLYPMPVWPNGFATFANSNFYAVSAASAHKEEAWQYLRWICATKDWQRSMMKLFLFPPALKELFPEYVDTVYAVAPQLRGRNLEVYVETVNQPVFTGTAFADASDQAYALMNPYLAPGGSIASGKMSVSAAFKQLASIVNSFEATQSNAQAGSAPKA